MKYIRYKPLLVFLIIISCCNVYIYINRDHFAFTKQSSYLELYPVTGNPSVVDLVNDNDSTIRIVLKHVKQKSLAWHLSIDDGAPVSTGTAEPVLTLKEGIHNYYVFSNGLTDTIKIKAGYISKKQLNKKYSLRVGGITIYRADLPVESDELYQSGWVNNEMQITPTEAAAIRAILKDSMGINDNENTFEKIKKIGQYLGKSLSGTRGLPSDSLNRLSVFKQYKAALNGNKIWCGNYAMIFNLFARSAHINTRTIQAGRMYGTMTGNKHVFNEYYIPEQKMWAAADITFNNVSYMDAAGRLLNAVQVKNLNQADSSVKVVRADLKGSFFLKSFSGTEDEFKAIYGLDKDLRFYKTAYTDEVYTFKQKVKRYVTKESWYEIYSDSKIAGNFYFYIKLLFLVIEFFILLLFPVLFVLRMFRLFVLREVGLL